MWQTKPEREQKEETKQSRWGFRGKTVWDFLQLLIVPLMLVAIGLVFSLQQDARQQRVEDQRAQAERELAEQRAQDEALQAYLDQMSQLMLERKLLEAEPGDPVHTLAQARTSTVILRLDAEHNESVTRFLFNSGLAVRSDEGYGVEYLRPPLPGVPVGSEASARLLSRIALPHATLSGAKLFNADLILADLTGAVLTGADLFGANLSRAQLSFANLSGANLFNADLSDADLSDADLSDADLSGADLSGAYLSDADLSGAYLPSADLKNADLSDANLSGANLSDANLNSADLKNADLNHAKGVTEKQLEKQARTLEGATMPNGQKYAD